MDPLLKDVEKFIKAHGISASRFGRDAAADPNFVYDLRGGREPRRKLATKCRDFMLKYKRDA